MTLEVDHQRILKSLLFQCSFRVCKRNRQENRRDIDQLVQQYGVKGSTFPCFYDWYSYQWGAVIKQKLPRMRVLHAMVWPILALLLGTLTCGIFCKRCRRVTLQKKSKDDNSDSPKDTPKAAEEINLTENTEMPSENKDTVKEEVKLKPQPSNKTRNKTKPPRRDKTKVGDETPNSTEKRNVWL